MKKTGFLSIILLLHSALSFCQSDSLIPNGDFEKGNVGFSSAYNYDAAAVNPGYYSVVKNASNFNPSFSPIPDHTTGNGYYLIADVDDVENKKIWCVTIPVDAGSEYVLEVWAANLNTLFRNPPEIGLVINDTVLDAPYPLSDANNNWEKLSWHWLSGSMKTATICLVNHNPTPDGNDFAIDDIKLIQLSKPKPVVVPPVVVVDNCPAAGDTIKNLVHFPFNESTLTEYSKKKLEVLLEQLNECPRMKVKVLGHADKHGRDTHNDRLSVKRAQEVYDYLLNKGINANRLAVEGLGEKRPVYLGNSGKEYVKNRRIEFVVY